MQEEGEIIGIANKESNWSFSAEGGVSKEVFSTALFHNKTLGFEE